MAVLQRQLGHSHSLPHTVPDLAGLLDDVANERATKERHAGTGSQEHISLVACCYALPTVRRAESRTPSSGLIGFFHLRSSLIFTLRTLTVSYSKGGLGLG